MSMISRRGQTRSCRAAAANASGCWAIAKAGCMRWRRRRRIRRGGLATGPSVRLFVSSPHKRHIRSSYFLIVASDAVLILIGVRLNLAFYVHRSAFAQVLFAKISQAVPQFYPMPLGLFYLFAAAVGIVFRSSNTNVGDFRAAFQVPYLRVSPQVSD